MNSKKLLSMLLVSLGVFSLGLTSCDNETPSSEPSETPTVEPSSNPSVEAPTDEPTDEPSTSVVPSDSESETPTDVPTDPTDVPTDPTDVPTDPTDVPTDPTDVPTDPTDVPTDPTDVPTDPTDVPTDPTDVPTDPTDVPTDPTDIPTDPTDPGVIVPESTVYDVTFNYDDWKNGVTVWTDYAIDGSEAIAPAGNSGLDLEGLHSVPVTDGGTDLGSYYFAIDANGYIVYASYGLGCGYGGPHDGYYHNQASKDPGQAEYWAISDEWAPWPNKTEDGRNAWSLYDILVPEDGFIIKGYAKDPEFVQIWTLLTGKPTAPVSSNTTLEGEIAPGALNKWYFSINEDHKLEIRERLASELADANGEQEVETPSKNFTPSADDEVKVYNTLEGVADLADDTIIENTKVVVVWVRSSNAIVQDVQGNNILIYDNAIKEVAVGDTLILGSAKKTTYNGYPELLSLTDVQTLTAFGKLEVVAPVELTAENVAEYWVEANNYGFFKLVGAEVVEAKKVKLGDTVIDLYSTTLPEGVVVGDVIDLELTMQCYNGALQAKANTEDIDRYYNISFDLDGIEETAAEVHVVPSGAELTVTATNADTNYSFSHWAKVVVAEDGSETLEKVSDKATLTVTVEDTHEEYVAVFNYAAWLLLPETYGNTLDATVKVDTDCGADALAVLTEGKLHTDGEWNNTSYGGDARWRFIAVVDANGKIAYAVANPANGYGGPSGTGYYAHPDYAADHTTNPAFNILDGYGPWTQEDASASKKFEIVVPEGGFIVIGHGAGSQSILTALGASDFADASVNTRTSLDDSARVYFDAANSAVKVYVDEANPEADASGIINAAGTTLPAVYNDAAEAPTLGDFTVAVDANGKIIFAGKTASGYGGPADGFYHDGTYAWVAGEHCGIFVLDPEFAAWPNTTEDGRNAWTLYTVKAPEGGHIITGTAEQMTPLMKLIDDAFTSGGNYFEGVADGLYNDTHVLTVSEGNKVASMNLEVTKPETAEGLAWGGATAGKFVYDEENALYRATIELAIWNKVSFTWTDAEGVETVLNYETATLAGLFTAADVNGADWSANLYHEVGEDGVDSATNGIFYTCTGGTYYAFYDPALNKLTVTDTDEIPVIAQVGTSVTLTGFEGAEFTWNGRVGAYECTVLVPKWTNFSLTYTDAEGVETAIWYDTATILGDVVATPVVGDQWTGVLFIDSDACIAAHQWMNSNDGGATYKFVYDPVTRTLTVKFA